MKKVFGKSLVLFVLLIYFLNIMFVLAQEEIPTPSPDTGQTNFDVFLGGLAEKLSGLFNNVQLDLSKSTSILLGILLWMIIYTIFRQSDFFGREGEIWTGLIAVIVTILSMIYIPSTLILSIGNLWGGLGATILTVLPFGMAFYFTVAVTRNSIIARAIWFIFFLYFLVIFSHTWAVNYDTINRSITSGLSYTIGGIASLIMFLTIPWWRERWWKIQMEQYREKGRRRVGKFGLALDLSEQMVDEASGRRRRF